MFKFRTYKTVNGKVVEDIDIQCDDEKELEEYLRKIEDLNDENLESLEDNYCNECEYGDCKHCCGCNEEYTIEDLCNYTLNKLKNCKNKDEKIRILLDFYDIAYGDGYFDCKDDYYIDD